MILSIGQCVWYLTKGIWNFAFFSYPITKGFWVEFWVGMKVGHTCITYFAKSKTGPQGGCKSYTLIKTCKCVEFYKILILNVFWYTFESWISLFEWMPFIWKYGFFFFSFLHALWHAFFSLMPFGMDIFSFSLFF